MTYCHVSAQCDAHARQLSIEQRMDDAAEVYMDEIRKDYGPRLDELAAALADYISEDDLNGCLAVYRMSNPRPPQPPAPKIDPKHSHRQGDWGCGMSSATTYPGTLYDYTAGIYCGVLVTERVMRKLARLQQQHLEAVQRALHDNKSDVFPSMWTLHYPNGVQTEVRFIDTSTSVEDRIKSAVIARQPQAIFPVFIAASMDEARALADARHEATTAQEGES